MKSIEEAVKIGEEDNIWGSGRDVGGEELGD